MEGRASSFFSRWQEIELANDTMGVFFTIQLACGPGDSIRQIFCGVRKDATELARAATNELWSFDWPGESDIIRVYQPIRCLFPAAPRVQ